MSLSKNSIKLLRQVKLAILAAPEFYAQNKWVSNIAPCGTTCCIAGWADFVVNGKKAHNARAEQLLVGSWEQWTVSAAWQQVAVEALGITPDQAERLTDSASEWPAGLDDEYGSADGSKGRALVAAKRIEHFIATGGAE